MKKTVTINLTLDEHDIEGAKSVLSENGLTVENLLTRVIERTAREGAIPLKKRASRPKKKSILANMFGIFVQGDLFESKDDEKDKTEDPGLEPENVRPKEEPLRPTLPSITSLQEAQAMLRWRERERKATPDAVLSVTRDGDKQIIETKQFRLDKVRIAQSPMKAAIIATLEMLFTVLAQGKTPADAVPTDDRISRYVPLYVPGIANGSLGLIYQAGDAEVCMVRYGKPEELLLNPPVIETL